MKFFWSSTAIAALLVVAEATQTLSIPRIIPVQSNLLRLLISKDELLKKGQKLQDFAFNTVERNRLIGSPGHEATIEYLIESLNALDYYDVTTQEFDVELSNATLSVDGISYETAPLTFTAAGSQRAPLVVVPNLGCDAADFPANTAGKIALISRGSCTFALKVTNAKAAGAVGAVIYQTRGVAGIVQGTLGGPGDYVSTAGISYEDGQSLIAASNGTTQIVSLTTTLYNVATRNVIAETRKGDKNNVLFVGAHSDSVAAGPGINDNGSGSIGILEVATRLSYFKTNNAVRFAWWSAEEEGLLGAEHYVQTASADELQKIRLYLNFDMIASPNWVYEIYDGDGSAFNISGAPGSGEAEKLFEDYFAKEAKLPSQPAEFNGRSDYGPFLDVGVPSGGTSSGADGVKTPEEVILYGGTAGIIHDPNYHTARDTLENLNVEPWFQLTKSIAHAVAVYANSWKGFPARLPQAKRDVKDAKAKPRGKCGSHDHDSEL